MCYVYGSIDQATGTCPMCKVFKPSNSRCPHIKEVCRNRALHPRHDVVYLKNAEVQTFTGCGYCKWARISPPPKQKSSGYQNPGWPGCCRAPALNEQRLIGAADWPAVSIVHHIPIPSEIKAILESITNSGTSRVNAPVGSVRGVVSQSSAPVSVVRRPSSNVVGASKSDSTPSWTSSPVVVPPKGRLTGSPQQLTASLTGNAPRNSGVDGTPSSLPSASAMDQFKTLSRRSTIEHGDKRVEPSASLRYSPVRKDLDLSGSLSRRGSSTRPSVSTATSTAVISKVTVDVQPQRRRAATVNMAPPASNPGSQPSTLSRLPDRQNNTPRRPALETAVAAMNISSASSSSSGGSSSTETTIISDGGFTDYLSDESEAELQRQAEVKAALLAQNQLEEQEFKAARQQLAMVDLRPPKSWAGNNNSTPRSQVAVPQMTSYVQSSGAPPFISGHTGVASAASHARG